ncbi:MAG TPA: hypothetical protein VI318_19735 [Baekduia sp.]
MPTPSARYLEDDDRSLLRAFACSTGPWYEDEVERFIRDRLIARHAARRRHTDHRIIGLEDPERGLLAVTAHESELTRAGDRALTSTLWIVAAVTTEVRGALLPDVDLGDGRPVTLGRYLAEVTFSDVFDTGRDPVVRAIVARENTRSLALCQRVGLTIEQADADRRYVQRLGLIAPD